MYDRFFKKYSIDLSDKNILITGANSGLGYELMLHLLRFNANVIMACRSMERAAKAKDNALKLYPYAKIDIISYDQSSFESIDNAIEIINGYHLFALVANAGIYYPKDDKKTIDGLELTIGTNYIGLDRLLYGLKDYLLEQKTRVVLVSSLVARMAKRHPFNEIEKISRNKRYAFSKLMINGLYHELLSMGIDVRLTHPGVSSTNIISNSETGLPKQISILGRKFLNIFTHRASKASLTSFVGVVEENYDTKKMVVPRGLFEISGYPRHHKIRRKYEIKNLHEDLMEYLNARKEQ